MKKVDLKKYILYFSTMSATGMVILLGQSIGMNKSFVAGIPGMFLIITLALSTLFIKDAFPKFPLPAYALSTIIGMIFSLKSIPVSSLFLKHINNVEFMAITTPLLAFAGISVGDKIEQLKEMSWKIVIIAVVVFTSVFFTCALIAQTVLKMQGKI